MPSIGTIRVDFLADVTKFVSGMNAASSSVSRMAYQVGAAINGIEKGTQKFGTGMTVKVTAPIAAAALAAVRAADTNGEATKKMQEDAKRLQQSFAPLGREIIRGYESARPMIQDLARSVRSLAESFEKLPQPTRDFILKAVAITAAVGPAALAISSVAKVAGAAWTPVVVLTGGIAKLTAGTAGLTSAMATGKVKDWFDAFEKGNPSLFATTRGVLYLGTAIAALETGRWIGKQGWMQNLMGIGVNHLRSVWGNFFGWLKASILEIKGLVLKVVGEIMATMGMAVQKGMSMLPNAVSSRLGFVSGGGKALQSWGDAISAEGSQASVAAMMQRYSMYQDYFGSQSGTAQFARSMMGPWSGGPSFMQSLRQDLAEVLGLVDGIWKSGPPAADSNTDAWKKWDGAVKAVKTNMEDLAGYAASMNTKYTPEIKKLQAELDKLSMLRVEGLVGPDKPMSLQNWERAVTDLRAQIKALEDQAARPTWMDNLAKAAEGYKQAVASIRQEYLQAYPEAAFAADIKRLEDLRDNFVGMGDFISANMAQGVIDDKQLDRAQEVAEKVQREWQKQLTDLEKIRQEIESQWQETIGGKLSRGIEGFASSVGDAFADMAMTGQMALDDLANSFIRMIIRTSAEAAVSPLFQQLGAFVGSALSPTPSVESMPWFVGPPRPHAAGGITSGPIFTHVAGEAGREVIAPLSQLPGLLARAGMGGSQVQIIDQRSGGAPIEVRETRGPDGRRVIKAIIKDAMAGGEFDTVMSSRFNTRANPR